MLPSSTTTQKFVAQTSFRLKDGTSGSHLMLPDTLRSGIYRFLLTNLWMNGNPTSPPTWKDIVVTSRHKVVPAQLPDTAPKAFPEGGTLINCISNRVVGDHETIAVIHARSRRPAGRSLLHSECRWHRFISFHSTKRKRILDRCGRRQFTLPAAADDGVGVLLTRRADNSIRVTLASPKESIYRKNPLFILITINGVTHFSQELSFGDLEFMQFGIPLNTLPAGIARLTVISNTSASRSRKEFSG